MSLKEKLTVAAIEKMAPNPEAKKNTPSAKLLYRICLWQHVGNLAVKEIKAAWKEAVAAKILPEDDDLRNDYKGKGECIVLESDNFSCTVKVAEPGERFDKDAFIEQVARRFKIDKAKLERIAETCNTAGTPALTKRVLEVA